MNSVEVNVDLTEDKNTAIAELTSHMKHLFKVNILQQTGVF